MSSVYREDKEFATVRRLHCVSDVAVLFARRVFDDRGVMARLATCSLFTSSAFDEGIEIGKAPRKARCER